MQFFRDTNIDFMRYRRFWLTASAVLLVALMAFVFSGRGLNLGIDFAGGTQLTVKFAEPPQIDQLRQLMADNGLDDALIQRFGDPADNSVIIKTPLEEGAEQMDPEAVDLVEGTADEDSDEGNREEILAAIRQGQAAGSGRFDINASGVQGLAEKLEALDPDQLVGLDADQAKAHYLDVATAVGGVMKTAGIITSWDQLSGVSQLTPEAMASLRGNAELGPFRVVGAENVGPQIGAELRRSGAMAVVLALLGMLGYIWVRFELRYGVGALVAVTHDVLITLGLFAAAGLEFNLTTIAGFLTLVGYSVNDSVVVFDRVRENLRQNRRAGLTEIMNHSLNQTLSRTVLTSGTTLLVVGCLLFLGGDVLRGFAFILTLGVIVGTYSSIYIASPFALWWERWFGNEARSKRRAT